MKEFSRRLPFEVRREIEIESVPNSKHCDQLAVKQVQRDLLWNWK
jgi:hypothetical protein